MVVVIIIIIIIIIVVVVCGIRKEHIKIVSSLALDLVVVTLSAGSRDGFCSVLQLVAVDLRYLISEHFI
jgi:hypothetical protein